MDDPAGKTILLVEDEKLLGNLLKRRLDREGFRVVLTRDGEEALRVLHEGLVPDLILLDIILPKISGFDFLDKIHTDTSLASLDAPVVVVSNLGQQRDVERAQTMGVIGYFVKAQLSFEELVGQVRAFFETPA